MLKKLLFAGACLALPFLSFNSDKGEAKSSNIDSYVQHTLTYSQLLGQIDPNTKLPKEEDMINKPFDFTFDKEGAYISKLYTFKDFNCSMFFAVEDMNYTKKENQVEVKLHKYPKYIKLEIPYILRKFYVDESQDGIDGRNEKEYIQHPTNYEPIDIKPIEIGEINSVKRKTELYKFLEKYLDVKAGLPKKELLTEKPFEITYMGGRVNVAKDYLLDCGVNEKVLSVEMVNSILYFPINDANFTEKTNNAKIILELSPNPLYINIVHSSYLSKENKVDLKKNLWFIDPNLDSINGNELSEKDYSDGVEFSEPEGVVI